MNCNFSYLGTILLCLFYSTCYSQGISGYVQNEKNEPIPYVNIYLKNSNIGTSTDLKGKYFLKLLPGEYDLVFSSVGYKIYEVNVIIKDETAVKNVWMEPSSTELLEIVVKASKKDPAYEIIQKVIDNKKDTQVRSIKSDVYIKAIEVLDKKEKKRNKDDAPEILISTEGTPSDLFESKKIAEMLKMKNTNMVEINMVLNYQYPDKYKEERTGYKLYGNASGLFIPRFNETDFNIFDNLIHLKGVIESPVISPISRTSILSYKYKLKAVLEEGGRKVYKIEVIPRKMGNSTCGGHVYVNDGLWNINRFELNFQRGALKFYDALTISQAYKPAANDSLWISYRQEFTYETKQNKYKNFKGSTVIHYSNYQLNYYFPPQFFSSEVAVTTKEAYERDSSYWNSTRPEPLTIGEQEVVHFQDSIHSVVNSKAYKDSIDARYNKITLGDLILDGIGFQNHEKKQRLSFSSVLNTVGFEVVGGFRLSPYAFYFKRFDNGKILWTNGSVSIGFKNIDLQGRASVFYRYSPFRLGDIRVHGGRQFQSINSFDAYLNQLKISNYILHDYISADHRIELFNGFYLRTIAGYSQRQSIEDYNRTSIINEVIKEVDPIIFKDYEALITDVSISFTPLQTYMREPNYKRVLGSRYPTFTLLHKKGWSDVLGSDINFDYGEFKIDQKLILGIFGNSNYSLRAGKFFNTKDLRYVDLRRFRQSDPYLYSDPLNSFQLLDSSLVANDWFFEAHHIHHFNGALLNNLPLIKKLRLSVVAGAGILWIKESNYRHEEVFAGVERVFKVGARRRLRIGVYGVLAESNMTPVTTDWKISFDIIDLWKKEWSY